MMKNIKRYGLILLALFVVAGLIYSQAPKNQKIGDSTKETTSISTTIEESQESEDFTKEPEDSTESEDSSEGQTTTEDAVNHDIGIDLAKLEFIDQEGNLIDLTQNIGRPMIINMWATWCPPCREEMPYFQKAWENHKEEIDFYLVNALHSKPNEDKEAVDRFVEKLGLTLPIYYDLDLTTLTEMQATFLPTTIFVNKEGEIVHQQIGLISAEELQEQIEAILD